MNDTKTCTKCKIEKPIEGFSFLRSRAKHASWCKECQNAYTKANLEKRRVANTEYRRRKTTEILLLDPDKKECSKCKCVSPLDRFPTKNGVPFSPCFECSPVKVSIKRERMSKEDIRKTVREKKWISYGLTEDQMEIARNATECEACGSTDNLCVDHCHDQLVFRGILCRTCNVALGMLKDDINRVRQLLKYMEK